MPGGGLGATLAPWHSHSDPLRNQQSISNLGSGSTVPNPRDILALCPSLALTLPATALPPHWPRASKVLIYRDW